MIVQMRTRKQAARVAEFDRWRAAGGKAETRWHRDVVAVCRCRRGLRGSPRSGGVGVGAVRSVRRGRRRLHDKRLIGPQLAYKITRGGGELIVADRWFPSSQLHHGCTTPDGTACRLVGKGRIDKHLVCSQTGDVVDRDVNAALNLRDWPDHASCGPVGTTAPSVPGPTEPVGTGHGADAGPSGAGGASIRPCPRGAGSGEARTQTRKGTLHERVTNTLNGYGVTRILQCVSGCARSSNAAPTPSRSTSPVIIGATSMSPSAIARRQSVNSVGS
jgi:hypothetical protein